LAMPKIQVLKRGDFPANRFFDHLEKGTDFYQRRDFERAIEEWVAAGRLDWNESIYVDISGDRIFFGSLLRELPLLFFLYAISGNLSSGISEIKTGGASKRLMFREGRIVFATTSKIKERIGNFILRRGSVTPEKMEQLVEQAKERKMRLGSYLVELRLLTPKSLRELLTFQIEEILSDVFSWKKGQVVFVESRITEEPVVSYSPLDIALVAARRGANFLQFRKEIPDNKVIFRPSPYVEHDMKGVMDKLDANQQFIFSLVDGMRNIDQLIKYSGNDEISVITMLHSLSSKGLIRRTKELVEYQDKEFEVVQKILEVLFEVLGIVSRELFRELGARGSKILAKAPLQLSKEHQKVFADLDLTDPQRMDFNAILRNISSHFPAQEQRFVFIDAFQALCVDILDELKRFVGMGLTQGTVQRIERIRLDIERFSIDSSLKDRLSRVLKEIVNKYG
jgi:hypothetical protein